MDDQQLTLMPQRTADDALMEKASADSVGGFTPFSCLLSLVEALETIEKYTSKHYHDNLVVGRLVTRTIAKLKIGMVTMKYGNSNTFRATQPPTILIGIHEVSEKTKRLRFRGTKVRAIIDHGRFNEDIVGRVARSMRKDHFVPLGNGKREKLNTEFCIVHEALFQIAVDNSMDLQRAYFSQAPVSKLVLDILDVLEVDLAGGRNTAAGSSNGRYIVARMLLDQFRRGCGTKVDLVQRWKGCQNRRKIVKVGGNFSLQGKWKFGTGLLVVGLMGVGLLHGIIVAVGALLF